MIESVPIDSDSRFGSLSLDVVADTEALSESVGSDSAVEAWSVSVGDSLNIGYYYIGLVYHEQQTSQFGGVRQRWLKGTHASIVTAF